LPFWCGLFRFFVGVYGRSVPHGSADAVQALHQNLLPRRGDLKLQHHTVLIGDGLVRQVYRQPLTFFFFRALEEFLSLLFGRRGGKSPALEAITVVEDAKMSA
jgi:hypothetical protein